LGVSGGKEHGLGFLLDTLCEFGVRAIFSWKRYKWPIFGDERKPATTMSFNLDKPPEGQPSCRDKAIPHNRSIYLDDGIIGRPRRNKPISQTMQHTAGLHVLEGSIRIPA
jgi:hypothetical protein